MNPYILLSTSRRSTLQSAHPSRRTTAHSSYQLASPLELSKSIKTWNSDFKLTSKRNFSVLSQGWQSGSLSFHWITYANQSSIIPPKPIASHQRQRRYSNENRQGSSSSRNTSNSGSNTGAPKDNSPPMGRLEKWRALDPAWKRFILIILVIAMGTEFAAEAVLFYKIPYPIYQSVLKAVLESEEVKELLGDDVEKTGWLVKIEKTVMRGEDQHVIFSFKVKGKKGVEATVTGEARIVEGKWKAVSARVTPESGKGEPVHIKL